MKLFLAALIFLASACPAKADGLDKALVSLTFDDAYKSVYEYAFPLLKEYGLKGTIFITTDWATNSNNNGFMGWNEIITLNQNGWEVGNHSKTHPDMRMLTDAEILHELASAEAAFVKRGLFNVVAFAFPFGACDERVVNLIKSFGFIKSCREAPANGINKTYPFDRFRIQSAPLDETVTFKAMRVMINEAISDKDWLVLRMHNTAPQSALPLLKRTVRYLYHMQKDQEMEVVTVTDAVSRILRLQLK